VVLVMGDGADRTLPRDLAGALNDLTRVLARALRSDYRATDLRVALLGDEQSPGEIASIARWPGNRNSMCSSWVLKRTPSASRATRTETPGPEAGQAASGPALPRWYC